MNIFDTILGISAVYGIVYMASKAYEAYSDCKRIEASTKQLIAETEEYNQRTRQMLDNFCNRGITDELKQILERNDIVTSDQAKH